ncbi:MAG: ATP-dependent Clp protease ATP-binding subunit, partial [Candidatus Magasanikbacteria bacterium]
FIRLGIPASSLQTRLLPILNKLPTLEVTMGKTVMPLPSPDFNQALFAAYDSAYGAHQDFVSVIELMVASAGLSREVQEILFDFNIKQEKLANAVEWGRIRERLYRQYRQFRGKAARRSKKGMDKAMTAVQTPYLNHFSEDTTLMAQFGNLSVCVARDREIAEMFRIVEGGQQSVILVGDHGVGKRTIVEGIAQKMVADDVPKRLQDKRMVRLSISSLLAGTTPAGAVERLQNIMHEIARARNVILFIHNIHELVGVSAGGEGGPSLDVATTLAEYLSGGHFLTFATTTSDDYARYILSSPLAGVFSKVDIHEMDENQAIQTLESKVGYAEYKHKVFFAYDALEKTVQLARKFLHDSFLPGNAIEVMTEAAAHAFAKKGANALVTAEEVAQVVSEKTKIPVTTVSADESQKLMRLETEMHERVVGQDEAVDLVASALRRARAEMRSTNRPIANFLFLGPTGVGKTELAKTIAAVYFGGEDKIIRLDMSEYQDKASVTRLIGMPGQKGTGVLTEAVRRSPFALVLLDEIEKADKDILNIFLQVMDDGRLSDSTGHVYDFTNAIIIATSNAGTTFVQEQMRAGLSIVAIKERLMRGELGQYFKPELLNRFDGIVLFKGLTRADIKKVAGMMMRRVVKDLESKGILAEVTDGALEFLAEVGFDPDFGARPMRRAIQEKIENKLADLLLSGKLRRRDTVVIGDGGEVSVSS